MKDFRNIKKEYGYILRHVNDDDRKIGFLLFLEKFGSNDINDRIYIVEFDKIINDEAYKYIRKKTLNAFRQSAFNVYENYVELFKILGIKSK